MRRYFHINKKSLLDTLNEIIETYHEHSSLIAYSEDTPNDVLIVSNNPNLSDEIFSYCDKSFCKELTAWDELVCKYFDNIDRLVENGYTPLLRHPRTKNISLSNQWSNPYVLKRDYNTSIYYENKNFELAIKSSNNQLIKVFDISLYTESSPFKIYFDEYSNRLNKEEIYTLSCKSKDTNLIPIKIEQWQPGIILIND